MTENEIDTANDQPGMEVPPPSTWTIRRLNPNMDAPDSDYIETITLTAHLVEINAAGNVVRFVLLYMDPLTGPSRRTVRTFMKPVDAWLDYEETPPPQHSLIVPAGSVSLM